MNLFRSALLALLACLVAACAQPDERETGGSDAPNPLLWEVARSDGSVEGWLMGTIHALPDGARWRNGAIDRAVADADILVMEIDDLDDRKAMAAAFQPLAFSDGQPPLAARVHPEQREQLTDLVGQTSYNLDDFARIESWSAALIHVPPTKKDGLRFTARRSAAGRALRERPRRLRAGHHLLGCARSHQCLDLRFSPGLRALLRTLRGRADDEVDTTGVSRLCHPAQGLEVHRL